MLIAALVLTAVAGIVAALFGGRATAALLSAIVGFGAALARLAFDSIVQRDAPDANRGRAFAQFETRFQLGWVLAPSCPSSSRSRSASGSCSWASSRSRVRSGTRGDPVPRRSGRLPDPLGKRLGRFLHRRRQLRSPKPAPSRAGPGAEQPATPARCPRRPHAPSAYSRPRWGDFPPGAGEDSPRLAGVTCRPRWGHFLLPCGIDCPSIRCNSLTRAERRWRASGEPIAERSE